ncbi:MAG: RNA polymerase sigma factor [Acidimicrobiia bacterium]
MDELVWVNDFESTFRAHYGRLVRALTVVAGSQEAANDAVQDAFVKAHLRWRRVSQYDDPVGWIRRVAINKLKDEHRRTGRKNRAVERLETQYRDSAVGEPVIDELNQLLGELSRQQRLCVALFYVEQLSVAEIAQTLDISGGAVKFHLHRGRERLRGLLTEEGLGQ